MAEHPIKDLMTTAMENLKQMIDVNTIIGDPVETPDGGIVLTVSKVGFGFAAGGSEFTGGGSSDSQSGSSLPFGGGSGGGVSITPIAFLVINKDGVQMLHLQQKPQFMERLLEIAPMAAEKIQQIMNESGQSKNSQQQKNKDSNSNSSKQSDNKEQKQNSDKEDENKEKNSDNKNSDQNTENKDSKDEEKDKKKSELDFDI